MIMEITTKEVDSLGTDVHNSSTKGNGTSVQTIDPSE